MVYIGGFRAMEMYCAPCTRLFLWDSKCLSTGLDVVLLSPFHRHCICEQNGLPVTHSFKIVENIIQPTSCLIQQEEQQFARMQVELCTGNLSFYTSMLQRSIPSRPSEPSHLLFTHLICPPT